MEVNVSLHLGLLSNGYTQKSLEEVTFPVVFWYLSIIGGLTLLIYAIFRKDPVIILGQAFGVFIYTRNLYLIYSPKND